MREGNQKLEAEIKELRTENNELWQKISELELSRAEAISTDHGIIDDLGREKKDVEFELARLRERNAEIVGMLMNREREIQELRAQIERRKLGFGKRILNMFSKKAQ